MRTLATPLTSTLPYAIYARLSENPDGTSDSVETQVARGIEEGGARWPGRPYVIFTDDDISAGDDYFRPGYEDMLKAIRRGEVGDVLARMQSRISRGEIVWPEFKVACLAAGITKLSTWKQGDVDLTKGGSFGGDIMNRINVEYRVQTSLSVNDALDQRAKDGRPGGGRPYGYVHERDANKVSHLVIVEREATVIRGMAAWVLAGWSLASVARHLNAEGITTKMGKAWTTGGVRVVLTNPVVTGQRVYKGKVVGDGNWTRILDRPTFSAVKATIEQPRVVSTNGHERVVKGTRRPARRHLLTGGLTVCGECGKALVAQMKTRSGDGVREAVYYCTSQKGGCGKVWINGEKLEALVVGALLSWVTTPAFRAAMAAADVDIDERERIKVERDALTQRLNDLGDQVALGEVSSKLAGIAEKRIQEEERALDRREADLSPLTPALSLEGEEVVQGWAGMRLEERRAVMFALRVRVTVGRAAKRRWSFESERVSVSFFEAPELERAKPRRKRATTKAKTSAGTSSMD